METIGLIVANVSLFIFWISLITAGVVKAGWQMDETRLPFSSMMIRLKPVFVTFVLSGITLMVGVCMILFPLLKFHLEKRAENELQG